MREKWLALLLAGVMCVAAMPGVAEEAAAFDAAQVAPLLNAVTAAAMSENEEAILLDEETALPDGFLSRLSKALQENGLDANAMGDLIAMPLNQEQNGEAIVAALTYEVITTNQSEDGEVVMLVGEALGANGETRDQRAVIELRRENASPVGWKLYRFSVGDAELEEGLLEGYIAEVMLEYVNAGYHYSIQYPAIFTEDMIVMTSTGIQAALKDDSASFNVGCMENSNGLNLEAVLKAEQENDPTAQVSVDEVTGSGKSVVTDEEGTMHVAVFLVSESYIYQAELNFPAAQAEEYAGYADYMINSFSADELGHG